MAVDVQEEPAAVDVQEEPVAVDVQEEPAAVNVQEEPAAIDAPGPMKHRLERDDDEQQPAGQTKALTIANHCNKRSREESDDGEQQQSEARTDAAIIAKHYNRRPNLGMDKRSESQIINLRNFNNWVKGVLIKEFTEASRAQRALDLACGKGGDLPKWRHTRIRELVGIDIAALSVEEARSRYARMRPSFGAKYHVLDAFHAPWDGAVGAREQFDVISCQFAYHYSFETEESAAHSIRTIAGHLREDGFFFGTIPHYSEIRRRMQAAAARSISNPIYSLRLDDGTDVEPGYGKRYFFNLEEAIDECPEYFIPFVLLEALAEEQGLVAVLNAPFPEFYQRFAGDAGHREMLQRMNVIDPQAGLRLTADELSVAELYMAFCFQKRTGPAPAGAEARR